MNISILTISKNLNNFKFTNLLKILSYEYIVDTTSQKNKVISKNTRLFRTKIGSLGSRKQQLIEKAKGTWILILDTDEVLSEELEKEIVEIVNNPPKGVNGFRIPYQNYVFGKPVHWGGEKYSKVRLFRNGKGRVTEVPLHEEVVVTGKVADLHGMIHHYSYRNPLQVIVKFTRYAWLAAGMKHEQKEPVTLKKLLLYGPHMFIARFSHDKGFRDGWRGMFLALAFGYMEALTYWLCTVRHLWGKK